MVGDKQKISTNLVPTVGSVPWHATNVSIFSGRMPAVSERQLTAKEHLPTVTALESCENSYGETLTGRTTVMSLASCSSP